jgi:hypothetical protein
MSGNELKDLSEFDLAMFECLEPSTGMVRHCAKHALHHLKKAWSIVDIDPEMAAFRGITAEEEAATAILIALKEKKYRHAEKLNHKRHDHKQAVYPFLRAIGNFLHETQPFPVKPHLVIAEEDGKKLFRIELEMPDGRIVIPEPPLGFTVTKEDGTPYHFDRQLQDIADGAGKETALAHIKELAQTRNHLLYADYEGLPAVTSDLSQGLMVAQRRVLLLVRVLCLIFPYKEKAVFVEQAIEAFLKMMGEIEAEAKGEGAA